MNRTISKILFIYLFLFLGSFSFGQGGMPLLTTPQLKQDLGILKTNLEEVHPGLYTYTPKETLDSLFDTIELKLVKPMTALAFYRLLLPLHTHIRNNHTSISPPESYVSALMTDLPRLPIKLYHRKDSLFVEEDFSTEQSIGAGALIKTINGKSALKVFHQMTQWISTDGYNLSFPHFVAGYTFSRRYAYFYGTPSSYTIEFVDPSGLKKTATIQAITFDQIIANRDSLIGKKPAPKVILDYQEKQGLAIMSVGSFQFDKSIEVKPAAYVKFLAEKFKRIKETGIDTLVLDLRNNGGGFPEAANKLLAYLIPAPVRPIKGEYTKVKRIEAPHDFKEDFFFRHFNRQPKVWDGQQFKIRGADKVVVKPNKNAFHGQLYVLINARSASATGELIGQIKSHCNVTFVGEESGGNPASIVANDLLTLVLPHSKVNLQLPAVWSIMNVSFENKGRGIIPDIECIPSIEAILNNRDEAMEKLFSIHSAKR